MNSLLLNGEIPINSFFITSEDKAIVVDPGFEKQRVLDYLKSHYLTLEAVILTHAHFDHIGAIDLNVPIYMHADEFQILESDYFNGYIFYDKENPFNLNHLEIRFVDDGDVIELGEKKLKVIHTPGHSPGGICIQDGYELYTGDTLFKGSIGRYDFPFGKQEILRESVLNLIETLDEHIIIYPAHGPKSTIGQEKTTNPYYLYWTTHNSLIPYSSHDETKYYQAKRLVEQKEYEQAIPMLEELKASSYQNMMIHAYHKMAVDKI